MAQGNGGTNDTLIRLEGVKKVFYTEDVETHAVTPPPR